MNKKLKKFKDFTEKRIVKIFFYLILTIIFYCIYQFTIGEEKPVYQNMWDIISNEITVSVALTALIALIAAKMKDSFEARIEESVKLEDNHHKIIHKYDGHSDENIPLDKNFYDESGYLMQLHKIKELNKRELKNKENDKYSSTYKKIQNELDLFNGKVEDHSKTLYLPSVNLFTNIDKNGCSIVFDDEREFKDNLPDFVIQNAEYLLSAHKHSKVENSITICLNDLKYEEDKNQLTLVTRRTNYLHMLITNRCMDYELNNGTTLRELYEYDRKLSPLNISQMANQIGINGLILTRDGYVLLEKRDNNKSTWKNKFSQSISLAFKEKDNELDDFVKMPNTTEVAREVFFNVISKTINSNYGLSMDEFECFSIENNFLGLARDLLEGGKPNVYFYLVSKCNAKELLEKLNNAAKNDDPNKALKTNKLKSTFYLYKYADIDISYNYCLKLNRRNAYRVNRISYPRSKRSAQVADRFKYAVCKFFKPKIVHECGEALLVSLSYLELCQLRIPAIENVDKKEGVTR